MTPLEEKLKAILAAHKNKLSGATPTPTAQATDKYGAAITYNDKQQEFISRVAAGESVVLLGAAGTGKTTAIKGALLALMQAGKVFPLQNTNHKHLPNNAPAIAICAYTRRATNNIRRNVSDDLKGNALTIHKLLEYEPVYTEYTDAEGNTKTKMNFEPSRNHINKLPQELRTIVIEEASMVAVDLDKEVENALYSIGASQFIYLGDIQQLPPVFGAAILGYKMLELPVIELTEVYRQALDSPIIKLAHRILSGVTIPATEFPDWEYPGKLKIHPWKKKISAENATKTLAKFFIKSIEAGQYNIEEDIILIPFNKSCGTIELNKHIANDIAKKANTIVYEIVHGFMRSYFSVGDKCLYDKEDAIILDIYPNPEYAGAQPKTASVYLDYWGHYAETSPEFLSLTTGDADIDFLLRQISDESEADTVRSASHCIKLKLLDSDTELVIKSAGDVAKLLLGYALTVHKAQGSEWRKVFLCLHNSHATMIQRELLYTGVTRAKEELFIICEQDTFEKGITSQRIKGNTLAEKAEYFKGKISNKEGQS